MWKSDKYYYFPYDLERFPDAWCYVIWSRRGAGKTYSALRFAYENGIKFLYMKRTNQDIEIVCNSRGGVDLSPFVPINRDSGSNVKPAMIDNGLGAFYDANEDGKPDGAPVAYIASLNAIKTIKGIDLSACDWIILDEFIPMRGEVIRQAEGDMLLSIYMTVLRDRPKRGLQPTKLILFANAENVSVPITSELDIIDDMVNLSASEDTHLYLEDRGILLHHIKDSEIAIDESEKTGIYKAMSQTAWGRRAFGGEFSGQDFSCVKKVAMKGYKPVAAYMYRDKITYIYIRAGTYYLTSSRAQISVDYDLSIEGDYMRFYREYIADFKIAIMEHRLFCDSYSVYDLITNYKRYFKII